jgi:hypothetical protein
MTKTEKTFSTRSNAKRAIASFRDKNPDLTMVGVSVAPAGDKFVVHATGWENAHVAAIDAAGFIRIEGDAPGEAVADEQSLATAEARKAARKREQRVHDDVQLRRMRNDEAERVERMEAAAKAASPKAKGNGARKTKKAATGERGPTKTDQGLDMLRRKKGVTVAEMGEAFGWLPHTTRAWISATAGKKMGNAIETEVIEGRGRVYRIAS